MIIHPKGESNNENIKHDTQILYVQMMQQIVIIYLLVSKVSPKFILNAPCTIDILIVETWLQNEVQY